MKRIILEEKIFKSKSKTVFGILLVVLISTLLLAGSLSDNYKEDSVQESVVEKEVVITAKDMTSLVDVYIYRNENDNRQIKPSMFSTHGGGNILGSGDTDFAAFIAKKTRRGRGIRRL